MVFVAPDVALTVVLDLLDFDRFIVVVLFHNRLVVLVLLFDSSRSLVLLTLVALFATLTLVLLVYDPGEASALSSKQFGFQGLARQKQGSRFLVKRLLCVL